MKPFKGVWKDYPWSNLYFLSTISSQSTNVASEKALVPNTALLQWFKNGRKALITKNFWSCNNRFVERLWLRKTWTCQLQNSLPMGLISKLWINESLIELAGLLFGIPQRSFFGPFLFVVFLFDLFYFEQYIDIAGYNGDSTS